MILKFHKELTPEKWRAQGRGRQILHILSELSRSRVWLKEGKGERLRESLNIALELIDLTVELNRAPSFRRETLRAREILAGYYAGVHSDDSEFVLVMRALAGLDAQSQPVGAALKAA